MNQLICEISDCADFPALALRAASEFDDAAVGKATTLDAAHQLAEILRESFANATDGGQNPVVVNAGSVAVLTNALSGIGEPLAFATVAELVRKAKEIADKLVQAKSTDTKSVLEQARDFCVALANAASSFREMAFESPRFDLVV